MVGTPALNRGESLAHLWREVRMRDGAPRIVSRASLSSDWGVSVSTVSSRLLDFAAAGIILREALGGNQGTRITFLREPTPDEIADRFTETAPSERSASSGRTPSKSRPSRTSAPPVISEVEKTQSGATDSANKVLPFLRGPMPAARSGSLAAKLSEPDYETEPEQPPEPEPLQEPEPDPVAAPAAQVSTSTLPALPMTWSTTVPVHASAGWPLTVAASGTAFGDIGERPSSPVPTPPAVRHPIPLTIPVRLPFFRPSHGLRLVSTAAVLVSIAMIAYHSAGSSASSVFHWWATLAMAIILSTGKVVLGSQAEGFFADGAKQAGIFCVIGALFLLCADASLLYAFRGDSLSNAAAMEKAAMETRARIKGRLDGLLAEQQRLIGVVTAAEGTADSTASIRLIGEVEADLAALEHDRDCRLIQPRARRGDPLPAKVPRNEAACESKRAELQAELARSENAAKDEARTLASAEKHEQRLAELPDLISKAEMELAGTQARAAPDHGATIVARGLNWIPAGVSDVLWGAEIRPVEGRGVEIFWSWAFVLAAEMFAVGGFAVAARADRRARDRRSREALGLA